MSLTLYFLKVKKGKTPNALVKNYWVGFRRMYKTYDYLKENCSKVEEKNGHLIFKIEPDDRLNILDIRYTLRRGDWFYDDECERYAIDWLAKRNMDFTKFDFYVFNA